MQMGQPVPYLTDTASTATLTLPEHWPLLPYAFHVDKLREHVPRSGELLATYCRPPAPGDVPTDRPNPQEPPRGYISIAGWGTCG